jgi:hypothetical protein
MNFTAVKSIAVDISLKSEQREEETRPEAIIVFFYEKEEKHKTQTNLPQSVTKGSIVAYKSCTYVHLHSYNIICDKEQAPCKEIFFFFIDN